jgi:membrane-bound lytic murein transglycosylase D
LSAGKKLILHVDNGRHQASRQRTKSTEKLTSSISSKQTKSSKTAFTRRYKVQPGDSLYTIAQKFPGCSYVELMKLNNMTRSALKVGQYILVPTNV